MSSIHIGNLIKKKAKELNIGGTRLGEMINTSKQNITTIYQRKTIDVDLLSKISKALDFNFFEYYIPQGLASNKKLVNENLILKKANEDLKKEITYLKKINDLLEKKKTKV